MSGSGAPMPLGAGVGLMVSMPMDGGLGAVPSVGGFVFVPPTGARVGVGRVPAGGRPASVGVVVVSAGGRPASVEVVVVSGSDDGRLMSVLLDALAAPSPLHQPSSS